MSINEYFGEWMPVVNLNEINYIVNKLKTSDVTICPRLKDVFKAFRLCSYRNLKVVIIGQDPYNNLRNKEPVATGIAFGNTKDTPESSYSPSLDVLRDSVINFSVPHGLINFDPSLEKWEEQGVLLLNSALTCAVGKPNSHNLLWRPFIKTFLQKLSEKTTGIVYVLMGSVAQSFESYINSKNNYIFKVNHPSHYARTHTQMPSKLWHSINSILIGQNGKGIEWFQEN